MADHTRKVLEYVAGQRNLSASEAMLLRALGGGTQGGGEVGSQASALRTTSQSAAYRQECEQAGVPVPATILDPATWIDHGNILSPFLSPGLTGRLWSYDSRQPDGVCLALPREEDGNIRLLGVICMGRQTGKVCFFDNVRNVYFPYGPVAMSALIGGTALPGNNQGVCSDCHAGENPFVVHPQNPAFVHLRTNGPLLAAATWPDPLVPAPWPENPGPLPDLPAPPANQRSCTGCHARTGLGGRFPLVSTELQAYCATVLGLATNGSRTMPPSSAPGNYSEHIAWLLDACDRPPPSGSGAVVDFDFPGKTLPPAIPILDQPIYACAKSIQVRGLNAGGTLRVYVNGVLDGTVSVTGTVPGRTVYFLQRTLNPLEQLEVVHQVGLQSASDSAIVRDHQVDYPNGLPPPSFLPARTHECASSLAVTHLIGATLRVTRDGSVPGNIWIIGSGGYSWYSYPPEFKVDDKFVVTQEFCGSESDESDPVFALPAPPVHRPRVEPDPLIVGDTHVLLADLIEGAGYLVEEVGSNPGTVESLTSWPLTWKTIDVATPLMSPVGPSTRLAPTQTLCGMKSSPPKPTPPPRPCSELPAPRVAVPRAGDNEVVVLEARPGATIVVTDSTNAVLGVGSGDRIGVRPTLFAGQRILVAQRVGMCEGRTAFSIEVANSASGG